MALGSNHFCCYHSPLKRLDCPEGSMGESTTMITTFCVCLPGAVFSECPFKEGYDVSIGTSERGNSVDQVTLPSFRHMLVVFGGLQGLEAGVDADPNLEVTDPSVLFDFYLNTCPSQGSRTIRTEEALLISLSALRPHIDEAVKTPTDS